MGWFQNDPDDPTVKEQLASIQYLAQRNNILLHSLHRKVDLLMADATKLTADVDALTAAVATAITDLAGLSADIAALKAAAGPDLQPTLDALSAKVEKATSDLSAATTANPA